MESKPHNYDKIIKEWKDDADNKMLGLEPDSYEYKIARSRVLKQYKEVPKVYDYIDSKYPKPKKLPWGKWVNDINNDLHGGLDKVLIILNYLFDHTLIQDKGHRLFSKHKFDKGWRNSMFFYCEDYNEMCENLKQDKLNIKPRSVHRYLRWLIDNQFIYVVGQIGQQGHDIYSIGYWSEHEDKEKKIIPKKNLWFLRKHKTPHDFEWRRHYEKALRSFKDTFPRTS
jgi:hypothetical protein